MKKDIIDKLLGSLQKRNQPCYYRSEDNKLFLDASYRSCLMDLNNLNITIEEVKEYGVQVIDPTTIINN